MHLGGIILKILAVGDLVGETGVEKLKRTLPNLQEAEHIDFTIINGENSAGGMGMTSKIYNELNRLNIDVITMGNHTWGKKDIFTFIDDKKIIRPANYSKGCPGKGYTIVEKMGKKIAARSIRTTHLVSYQLFALTQYRPACCCGTAPSQSRQPPG